MKRFVNVGHPARRSVAIEVEMLMLHTARLDGQQNQVAAFPVLALAFDYSVAFSLDDIDRKSALVAMLTGASAQFMSKNVPVLQHRVVQDGPVEVVAQPTLAGHLFGSIAAAYHYLRRPRSLLDLLRARVVSVVG